MLRHTVPFPFRSSALVLSLAKASQCGEEPSVVESSLRAGISYRTRKGGNHVSGMPSLWVAARSQPHLSVSPLGAVSAKAAVACEGDRAGLEAAVFLAFPPRPAWFTPGSLQVPPATVAAAPTLGLSEASKETRNHLNQQDRLPLPFLNAQSPHPCPSAPCLAVCTVCIALRKGGTAGVRRRGWRGGKLSTHPPSPAPQPELAPSERLRKVSAPEASCLPGPMFPVEQVLPGEPASNLHT